MGDHLIMVKSTYVQAIEINLMKRVWSEKHCFHFQLEEFVLQYKLNFSTLKIENLQKRHLLLQIKTVSDGLLIYY